MVSDLFRYSEKKCVGDVDRLFRDDIWTTNGYWLLRSEYELKGIKKLRNKKDGPDIKKVVKQYEELKNISEVFPSDHLKIHGDVLALKLKNEQFNVWVNVYYYLLFDKMARRWQWKFYQDGSLGPVIVKSMDVLMGAIMPIRII